MIIDDVFYNKEWAKSISEKEFVNHIFPIYFQDLEESKRKEKLKSIYYVLTGKKNPEETE